MPSPWYGSMLAAGSDISGDGYSDLVISQLSGTMYLHLGSATSVPTTASSSFTPTTGGNPVANSGDTNGDHFADLAVGSGGSWFVHPGQSGGIASSPSLTVTYGGGGMTWFVRP